MKKFINQSDLVFGICRRLMIFVVVLKLFEGVLKVFLGANFRIKRAHRTQAKESVSGTSKPIDQLTWLVRV
jgi:hypothetical protein